MFTLRIFGGAENIQSHTNRCNRDNEEKLAYVTLYAYGIQLRLFARLNCLTVKTAQAGPASVIRI